MATTRSSRRRCLAIIITGIVLKTLIIITLIVTCIHVRNPTVRFRSVAVDTLIANFTAASVPSISIRLKGQVAVKNPNFGQFRFSHSAVSILHRGNIIGIAAVPGGAAGVKSTKKLNLTVVAQAAGRSLGMDLSSGKIRLSGRATLDGKVHLLKVFTRKEKGVMNCTVDVNVRTRAIERVECL